MPLTIREVEPEEIEEFRSREWSRYDEEVGIRWDSRRYSLVAEVEGEPVGIAVYHIAGGVGHLDQLLVTKEHQGLGIGSQLLEEFERRCRAAGCHRLTLETAEYQAPEFYRKRGFEIACTMRDNKFHRTWYLMEKTIVERPDGQER